MAEQQQQPPESIFAAIGQLVQAWAELLQRSLELAALELKLAGKSLIVLIVSSIALIILGLMMWIFLMAAAAAWLVSLQFSWLEAFLLIVGLHGVMLLLVGLLWMRAKYYLTFPETRKQLGLGSGSSKEESEV